MLWIPADPLFFFELRIYIIKVTKVAALGAVHRDAVHRYFDDYFLTSAVFQCNSSKITLHEKSKALGQQRFLISDRECARTVLVDTERFLFSGGSPPGLTEKSSLGSVIRPEYSPVGTKFV